MNKILQYFNRGIRAMFVGLIRVYQRCASPLIGQNCRYHPMCSEYAIQALNKYGLARGVFKGIARILRCHPFSKGGYDPVK